MLPNLRLQKNVNIPFNVCLGVGVSEWVCGCVTGYKKDVNVEGLCETFPSGDNLIQDLYWRVIYCDLLNEAAVAEGRPSQLMFSPDMVSPGVIGMCVYYWNINE